MSGSSLFKPNSFRELLRKPSKDTASDDADDEHPTPNQSFLWRNLSTPDPSGSGMTVTFDSEICYTKVPLGSHSMVLKEGKFLEKCKENQVLPYISQEPLAEGSFGKVYKVRIASGHYKYRGPPSSTNREAVWMARKDFDPIAPYYKSFLVENNFFNEAKKSPTNAKAIMTPICSIKYPVGQPHPLTSIFFPMANCNLYEYITDIRTEWNKTDARLKNIKRMIDICHGLEWLSDHIVDKSPEEIYFKATYYHCDLKPDNILVCDDPDDDENVIFKISDFGEARNREDSFLSETLRKREGATYFPPETQSRNKISDVWSFGCIFLLIILFNYRGSDGVKSFERERQDSGKLKWSDSFAESESGQCSEAVATRLEGLVHAAESSTKTKDGKLTKDCLLYLQKSVLVKWENRDDIRKVYSHLQNFYNKPRTITPKITKHPRIKSSTQCASLMDGAVAFCKTKSIEICGIPGISDPIIPLTNRQWSKQLPYLFGNDRIIVPLKTIDNFQCDIFKRGNTAGRHHFEGISRSFYKTKSPPEKVAMSPNGTMIAVIQKIEDNKVEARLYHVPESRPVTPGRHSSSADSTFSEDEKELFKADIRDVESRTITSKHLCFSSDSNYLYFVWGVSGRNHSPFACVRVWDVSNLSDREKKPKAWNCTIHDTYTEFGRYFLTTIVPFNTHVGFLCVKHEREITEYILHGSELRPVSRPTRIWSSLKAIRISSDDKNIVILRMNERKPVFEVYSWDFGQEKLVNKVQSADKIRFDPKEDATCLVEEEENGVVAILITSLEEAKTYEFNLST